MNKNYTDEKLDALLKSYCADSSPYTLRFKMKTRKKASAPGQYFRYSTVCLCMFLAFIIGLCSISATKIDPFKGMNEFTIQAKAANNHYVELKDKSVPIKVSNVYGVFNDSEKDYVEIAVNFYVSCYGRNIRKVTYTSDYAYFVVRQSSHVTVTGKNHLVSNNIIGTPCTSFVEEDGNTASPNLVCRLNASDNSYYGTLVKNYQKNPSKENITELLDALFSGVRVHMNIEFYDSTVIEKHLEINYDGFKTHKYYGKVMIEPNITVTVLP